MVRIVRMELDAGTSGRRTRGVAALVRGWDCERFGNQRWVACFLNGSEVGTRRARYRSGHAPHATQWAVGGQVRGSRGREFLSDGPVGRCDDAGFTEVPGAVGECMQAIAGCGSKQEQRERQCELPRNRSAVRPPGHKPFPDWICGRRSKPLDLLSIFFRSIAASRRKLCSRRILDSNPDSGNWPANAAGMLGAPWRYLATGRRIDIIC